MGHGIMDSTNLVQYDIATSGTAKVLQLKGITVKKKSGKKP
jgi:hypothetical protein